MNRDERHDRIPELPPQFMCEGSSVFGPFDPASSGTWIAYNHNQYWGCLLNGYFENCVNVVGSVKSRGQLLPSILSQSDPLKAVHQFDFTNFSSFRLLIGSTSSHKLLTWDGHQLIETAFHASHEERIFFLSSSSWQQDQVIEVRQNLFKRWIKNNFGFLEGDEVPSFHFSRAPSPESAILMNRLYSSTKSITSMTICSSGITMSYKALDNVEII